MANKHWNEIIERNNDIFCIICHYIMEIYNLTEEEYKSMCLSNSWDFEITINKHLPNSKEKRMEE